MFKAMIARMLSAVARRYAARRPPDFIIGTVDDPYVHRWWVIPRNKVCNIYLHLFLRDDDDCALHDHPWDNASLVLASGYNEVVPVDVLEPAGLTKSIERRPGDLIRRTAEDAHRVVLRRDEHGRPIPAWSLFMTGKLRRTWGFWCPKGWRHYKKFVELKIDSEGRGVSSVGRGCDD